MTPRILLATSVLCLVICPTTVLSQEAPAQKASENASGFEATASETRADSLQAGAGLSESALKKKRRQAGLDPMTADLADLAAAGYKITRQKDGSELFCRREPVLGSRISRKTVCYTRAELKELEMATREQMLKSTQSTMPTPQ